MSAEEIYKDALLSISKNTCCNVCREASLVAKSALDTVEALKTAQNSVKAEIAAVMQAVIIAMRNGDYVLASIGIDRMRQLSAV